MPINRLNHAVLFVRDADRSADFYTDVLGFRRLPLDFPGGVFLQAEGSTNDHDLGLVHHRREAQGILLRDGAPSACTTSHGRWTRSVISPTWPRG